MFLVKKEESCYGDNLMDYFFLLMVEYVVFMYYDFNELNLLFLSLCGNLFWEIDNDWKNFYILLVLDGFFFIR